jgi:acetyl esterase
MHLITRLEKSHNRLAAPSFDWSAQGLATALVITDENDVLRDEGEAYAHKLMQANVTVTATRYLGTIHDFMMLNAIADTTAVRGAIDQASEMQKKALAAK